MSITQSINSALSGLIASSRAAETVSTNLANALTEGYGVRRIDLTSGTYNGVSVTGVTRFVDNGILADRRLAEAKLGMDQTSVNYLQRLEDTVGTSDETGSLPWQLARLEGTLIEAASTPSSDIRLRAVTEAFKDVTDSFHLISTGIQTLREEAEAEIAFHVADLNRSLEAIAELNTEIAKSSGSALDINGLLDQRQQLVDKVAEVVPIRELSRDKGQIALMTAAGTVLVDGPASTLGFEATPTITAYQTVDNGLLNSLTLNGNPLDVARSFAGGAIAAAFEVRDTTLVEAQANLDALARDLVERFEAPATDPSLAPGDAGLLTDLGAAFDPADEMGLSARIQINPSVDPAGLGTLSLLRDGLSAATPGPVGSATQLERWLGALQEQRTLSTGGQAGASSELAADFLTGVAASRVRTEQDQAVSVARWDTLKQAELAGGVDSDFELQQLLLIEQAYSANAKVIETANDMMRTLMEI